MGIQLNDTITTATASPDVVSPDVVSKHPKHPKHPKQASPRTRHRSTLRVAKRNGVWNNCCRAAQVLPDVYGDCDGVDADDDREDDKDDEDDEDEDDEDDGGANTADKDDVHDDMHNKRFLAPNMLRMFTWIRNCTMNWTLGCIATSTVL